MGAYDDAHRYFLEAHSILGEQNPTQDLMVGSSLHMVARSLAALGRTDEAREGYARAVALIEGSPEGPETLRLARARNDQAGLLELAGDLRGAEAAYRVAWQRYRDRLGDRHPFTAIVEGNVGSVLLAQNRLDAAEPLVREALATVREAYGERHTSTGVLLVHAGTIEMRRGELAQAEGTLRQAVDVLEAALPEGHWRIAQARLRLGRCVAEAGRPEEGEPLVLAAFRVLDPARQGRPRDHAEALQVLQHLYDALGRPEDAERYRRMTDGSG
jgi:tetratricopeptide (TPR) repeat protein